MLQDFFLSSFLPKMRFFSDVLICLDALLCIFCFAMTDEGTLSWIVKLHFKFLQPKSAMSATQKTLRSWRGRMRGKKKNECTFLIDFLLRVKRGTHHVVVYLLVAHPTLSHFSASLGLFRWVHPACFKARKMSHFGSNFKSTKIW